MLKVIFYCIIIFEVLGFKQHSEVRKYVIIQTVAKHVPGFSKKVKLAEINKIDIDKLNEPLKALAAFYSAFAGSNCDKGNCELTSALGLGAQGSNDHKALIRKWFSNDKIAQELLAQDCFQSPIGSSKFSNYKSLIFEINNEIVIINFSVIYYDHGKSNLEVRHNKAIVKKDKIILIR